MNPPTSNSAAELRARLNAETARIAFAELAPHFARGAVVHVDAGLDLVEVAACFAEDRRADVEDWLRSGAIGVATDAQAQAWADANAEFWAVVVAPWVLVQPAGKDPA